MEEIRPTLPRFPKGTYLVHLKTEGMYRVEGTPMEYLIEESREPAYAYRKIDDIKIDHRLFVRSQTKMEDGRFMTMADWTKQRVIKDDSQKGLFEYSKTEST